jgi:hypothetical protein
VNELRVVWFTQHKIQTQLLQQYAMASHHHKQFMFLILTSSIHILDYQKYLSEIMSECQKRKNFLDRFITVKAVM